MIKMIEEEIEKTEIAFSKAKTSEKKFRDWKLERTAGQAMEIENIITKAYIKQIIDRDTHEELRSKIKELEDKISDALYSQSQISKENQKMLKV